MKSETLSSKIIINELDFLREQLLFNETFEKKKKDLLLLGTKVIGKILIFVVLKNTMNHL